MSTWLKCVVCTLALAWLCTGVRTGESKDVKMKPEELVEKHLASIGTAEARAAARTRSIAGPARFTVSLGGSGLMDGTGSIFSEGPMSRFGLNFGFVGEQLACDGKKVTVGEARPGQQSELSAFIYRYNFLMREGLLGGTMMTGWALLDVVGRRPKLSYEGTKKIDGKRLHELEYRARKDGDLRVTLYFDPETFQHVYSSYRAVRPAFMSDQPSQTPIRNTVYTLSEQFGDFKTVDNLTLPHSWKMSLLIEAHAQSMRTDWAVPAGTVTHNQPIDPAFFAVR